MRVCLGALIVASLAGLAVADDAFMLDVDVNKWAGTPLDFSYLNRRLTAADKVVVKGDAFYRVGADEKAGTADDQAIRFFGVNLAFAANFPDHTQADLLAKRLAILGVNLVRIHHIDTQFAEEDGNSRAGILQREVFPTFDGEATDRLTYLLKRLAQAGIYTNLNLHVGYTFNVERDKLTTIPSDVTFPYTSSPFHIVLPELIERQKTYACELIKRLELKQAPPALAMLEINNESSLVDAWQRGRFEPASVREEVTHLRDQWQQFQQQKSWPVQPELVSAETGKLADQTHYVEFLASLDQRYLSTMKNAVTACLDGKVPMTGTQMAFGGLINQATHHDMDFLDTHFYVDHYKFPQGWREDNWLIDDVSMTLGKFRVLAGIAPLQQTAKPFTVSEFNQPWPNQYGHEVDITTAAFGLVQGWDALIHFNYANDDKFEERIPKGFNLHGDPARLAAFGQAARLFRTQQVNAPVLQLPVSKVDMLALAAQGVKQKETGDEFYRLYKTRLDELLNHRVSTHIGTGKIRRDDDKSAGRSVLFEAEKSRLSITTTAVWSLSGRVQQGQLGNSTGMTMSFPKANPRFAMATLSALDNKPVAESARLLLTIPGPVWRSVVTNAERNERSPEVLSRYRTGWTIKPTSGKMPSASLQEGQSPVWMYRDPVIMSLAIGAGEWRVYPLSGDGQRMPALASELVKRKGEAVTIDMSPAEARQTAWYELVRE